MKKQKIKNVLKRLPQIIQIIKDGKDEENLYINHCYETIEIDEEVRAIVEILDEIIAWEKGKGWVYQVLIKYQQGKSDVSIIIKSPVSRAKYYAMKENLVGKIYACCIFKCFVSYEDILNEEIG